MKCYVAILSLGAVLVGLTCAQTDYGNGLLYRKYATADVFLERQTTNFNFYDFLIVSKHPNYSKKRSLVQFSISNIPSTCNVTFAKMYLKFWYAHKASFDSIQEAPYLSRQLQVHQVKKEWSETQATRDYRLSGTPWSAPYLAVNGTDASSYALDCVIMHTGRPADYVEFDVTVAVKNWLAGEPNYGLLVWDFTEDVDGRDLRFYSHEQSDTSKRPFLNVLCAPTCLSCQQYPPPVCPCHTSANMTQGNLTTDSITQQQSSCPAVTATHVVIQQRNTCTAVAINQVFTGTQQQSYPAVTATHVATQSFSPTETTTHVVGDKIIVDSKALYGAIAADVIAFIGLLFFSIIMCYTSYRCGVSKGKRLEVNKNCISHDGSFGLVKNEAYDLVNINCREQQHHYMMK